MIGLAHLHNHSAVLKPKSTASERHKKLTPCTTVKRLFGSASAGLPTPSYQHEAYRRASCQFTGLTGSLRGRHWVSSDTFHQALIQQQATRSFSGIGVLPSVFVNFFDPTPKNAFTVFDTLADELRQLTILSQKHFMLTLTDPSGKMEHKKPRKLPITLQFYDSGAYGQVYQLTIPNYKNKRDQTPDPAQPTKQFALKLFNMSVEEQTDFFKAMPVEHVDELNPGPQVHGTLHEQASGLYFSDEPICDLARFHFGNPLKGWAISEWIEPGSNSANRPGPKLCEKVPSITLRDNKHENHQGNVRVDLGGIFKPKSPVESSMGVITDDAKTPAVKIDLSSLQLTEQLRRNMPTDPIELFSLNRLITHLKHKPPVILSPDDFEEANHYREPLKRLKELPHEADRIEAFQELMALKRPELTPLLFRLVEFLPSSERLQAMRTLLPQIAPETPVHLREAIFYSLACLTSEDRQQFDHVAFQWVQQQVLSHRQDHEPPLYALASKS